MCVCVCVCVCVSFSVAEVYLQSCLVEEYVNTYVFNFMSYCQIPHKKAYFPPSVMTAYVSVQP